MKRRIALLGPPASGKGTLAQALSSRLGIPATSAGALLRAEREADTAPGRAAAPHMLRGELVPDPIVLEVVGRWIESRARAFLLDGFPRTLAQADALDRFLKTRALPLEIVFALEIDEATGAERMRRRLICAGCRKSVNIGHHVPDGRAPCPYCGGTLVHRPDDRDDVFARRMDVYRRDTRPVLDHYAQRGILRRLEAGRPAEPLALDAVRLLEETS